MYVCSICNLFKGNDFSAVLRHIGEIHRYDPSLVIRCGIDRCPQTYMNFESFRSHIYRKHRDVLHCNSSHASSVETFPTEGIGGDEHLDDTTSYTAECNPEYLGAKLLLKIREQYRVPQCTLTRIVGDIKALWEMSQSSIKENVLKCVEGRLTGEEFKNIEVCFNDTFPLSGLETEYMQLNYYKQNLNYLVC